MIGIYKYTNLINGKGYIGQSSNIEKRDKDHRSRAFCESSIEYNSYIHKAFRKYGLNNFSFEILQICKLDELNELEEYFIMKYNSLSPNGYNLTLGGDNGHINKLKSHLEVQEIISLLQNTNLTNKEIGEKFNVSDQMVSDINRGRAWVQDKIEYPIRKQNKKNFYYCKTCGHQLKEQTKTGLCINCYNISQRKVKRPSRDELKQKIRKESFVQIGKEYQVSDNTVRKWCESYSLPSKKNIIKSYSDEVWDKI